jgi:hypothetical protein
VYRLSVWCRLLLAVPLATSGCSDWTLPRRAAEVAGDTAPGAPGRAQPLGKRGGQKETPATAENEAERFASVRKDLRRLVASQETFFAENGAYSGDLSVLGFIPEKSTSVRFLWVTRDGWAASGSHSDLADRDCVVFVGQVHAPPTTLKYVRQGREGVPVCDGPSRSSEPVAASPAPAPKPAEPVEDTGNALEALNPRTLMKADLRNLVRSQETYFATQGVYALRTGPLALQYLWRPGVQVKILTADRQSWAAKATHARLPGKSCIIWFGSIAQRPVTDAQRRQSQGAGVPVCDD